MSSPDADTLCSANTKRARASTMSPVGKLQTTFNNSIVLYETVTGAPKKAAIKKENRDRKSLASMRNMLRERVERNREI